MQRLLQLVSQELGFLPEGDGMDRLFARGEWLTLPSRHVIISAGQRCSDVFLVRDGIIRFVDFDGDKERTFAFAMPGTMIQSKHSFVMHQPSHFTVETCCRSVLLRISENDFWEVVNADHNLALWMLHYAYGELYYQEYKYSNIHNGTAKDCFKAMLADRPEIIEKVPQRIVASYLGITPEYLSSLKRRIILEP